MNVEELLTGGGIGGALYALSYGYRQWKTSRQEAKAEPRVAATSAVTDAAAANSLLLAALQEERVEVQRLSGEVQELRMSNAKLYDQMREQRQTYEHEIDQLRGQVDGFRQQLDDLQRRLSSDTPPQS